MHLGEVRDVRNGVRGLWLVGTVFAGIALFVSLGASRAPLPGREVVASIVSEGVGRIAVRVAFPDCPRYPEGAPVIAEVPTFATPVTGFTLNLAALSLGAVHVTLNDGALR